MSTPKSIHRRNRRHPNVGAATPGAPHPHVYSLRQAFLAQASGSGFVFLILLVLLRQGVAIEGAMLMLALLQGGIAALTARRQRAPFWWLLIHLGFLPLVIVALRLQLPPWLYLACFILLLGVFWRTDRSRVPLYLTNRQTAAALAGLLAPEPMRLIDLGCGQGGLLCRLARLRPDCEFVGIEHAPLPWLIARFTALRYSNVTIRHGDLWQIPLAGFDRVYAFLSPAPMARLGEKARHEMSPQTLLISNSFEIPCAAAEQTVHVGDRRNTRLYCYRPDKTGDFTAIPPIPAVPDQQ